MAMLVGLQKKHTYIYGRHVVVSTDHKPLLGVFNKNTQSICPERIALRCQDYDFTLTYQPGSENIADGLSRLPLNTTGTGTSFVEEHVRFVKSADALLSLDEIKEAGESDPELLELLKVFENLDKKSERNGNTKWTRKPFELLQRFWAKLNQTIPEESRSFIFLVRLHSS